MGGAPHPNERRAVAKASFPKTLRVQYSRVQCRKDGVGRGRVARLRAERPLGVW